MKKYILTVAVLLTGVGLSNAGDRTAGYPKDDQGISVFAADYAGMDTSTASFTTNNTQAFVGEGVVAGVIVSSGTNPNDYIIFRDTANVVSTEATEEVFRVYVGSSSIGAVATNPGVLIKLPYPVRVRKGLAYKASVGTLNLVTVLYNKFGN